MDIESSFYGYQDWQPFPSPNVTPQSERIFSLPETSPSQPSHDIFWTPHETPTREPKASVAMPPSSTRRQPSGKSNTAHKFGQDLFRESPAVAGPNQNDSVSFPTNSFIQKFEDTNMDDAAASQIRTPPPTRDQKRKSQQQIRWQTPSTVASRRVSTPSDAWLKRADARAGADGSPLNFHTPSQFPPIDFANFPTASEPATAPAYPVNDLFWDPSSNFHASFSPASTIYDDPFSTAPQPQMQNSFMQNISEHDSTPRQMPSADLGGISQAQSLSTLQPPIASPEFDKHHGVDPSMLFTSQPPPLMRSLSSSAANTQASLRNPAQPKLSIKTNRPGRPRKDDLASSAGGLKRTSSDARSRDSASSRSHRLSNASSRDYPESVASFASHVPRRSSPLKRPHAGPEPRFRKSVELVLDGNGTAKTIVKMVPIPPEASGGDDDDDDDDDILLDRPSSRQETAQAAIKEVVAQRRRARQNDFF